MDALKDKDYGKGRIRYPDYVTTASGLQYKDFREGTGDQPKAGGGIQVFKQCLEMMSDRLLIRGRFFLNLCFPHLWCSS